MKNLLDLASDFPEISLSRGESFLSEGETSDKLFILAEGAIEVHRDGVTIALVTEPGSVFGEMSVLLGVPHTADVRAATDGKLRVIEAAKENLANHNALVLPIARLLARRLQNANAYLVDLKKQFQDKSDHFALVDQVLESLSHQQDEQFTPGDDLPSEP